MKRYTLHSGKTSYDYAYFMTAAKSFVELSNVFDCSLMDNETGETIAKSKCYDGVVILVKDLKRANVIKGLHKRAFLGMSELTKPYCAHLPKEDNPGVSAFESEELKAVLEVIQDETITGGQLPPIAAQAESVLKRSMIFTEFYKGLELIDTVHHDERGSVKKRVKHAVYHAEKRAMNEGLEYEVIEFTKDHRTYTVACSSGRVPF